MNASNWYRSRAAIFFYHILTWTVTLFLPYLVRPVIEHRPEKPAWADSVRMQERVPGEKGPVLRGTKDFRLRPGADGRGQKLDPDVFTNLALALNLFWILLFYVNAYWLIPRLIYRKELLAYIGIQLAVFLLVAFSVSYFIQVKTGAAHFYMPMPILMNIFPFLFVQSLGIAFRMIIDKIRSDKLVKEKEYEGLKTELSFLRSQISPHFIFNVLNNMVSLARKKSDRLEPSLIRLSGLMRYMLYESDETRVPLCREIEYLESYINLQTLRFGNDIRIHTDLGQPDQHIYIEPMLLIPFVENAFKHSAAGMEDPFIDIRLSVTKGVLDLSVKNNYRSGEALSADRSSGIGLANVKRRLNLLYGNKHVLLISETNGIYKVSLQINLL